MQWASCNTFQHSYYRRVGGVIIAERWRLFHLQGSKEVTGAPRKGRVKHCYGFIAFGINPIYLFYLEELAVRTRSAHHAQMWPYLLNITTLRQTSALHISKAVTPYIQPETYIQWAQHQARGETEFLKRPLSGWRWRVWPEARRADWPLPSSSCKVHAAVNGGARGRWRTRDDLQHFAQALPQASMSVSRTRAARGARLHRVSYPRTRPCGVAHARDEASPSISVNHTCGRPGVTPRCSWRTSGASSHRDRRGHSMNPAPQRQSITNSFHYGNTSLRKIMFRGALHILCFYQSARRSTTQIKPTKICPQGKHTRRTSIFLR